MNKLFILIFFIYILPGSSTASANDSLEVPASNFSLGLNLNEIRNQPGAGLTITTPYFFNGKIAFRFSGHLFYIFNIPLSSASEQALPYANLRFGAVYIAGTLAGSIRLCLVGGAAYTLPGRKISDDKGFGGYLGLGFEFFTGSIDRSRISFHLESSVDIIPLTAEKLPGQPIYASGIDLSVGARYYF